MRISGVVVLCALLHAGIAEARFGKAGSGGANWSGSPHPTHAAVPVDSKSSSSSSSSSSTSSSSGASTSLSGVNFDANRGYYTGAFVPMFGYAVPTLIDSEGDQQQVHVGVRATGGLEAIYFTNQNRGYALGINAGLEIERFGVFVSAQHLTVATDDGSNGDDRLTQLNVRLSYALYVGKYGRLRAELGADTIFAADTTVLGPTFGFSGSVWIMGPLAFEASLHGSVYPFWQLDGRAGLVVGIGALGLRLGFRTQLLDDQGIVDGVAHRDVFMGPYAGLGFAL